jgi:hypothetical protein
VGWAQSTSGGLVDDQAMKAKSEWPDADAELGQSGFFNATFSSYLSPPREMEHGTKIWSRSQEDGGPRKSSGWGRLLLRSSYVVLPSKVLQRCRDSLQKPVTMPYKYGNYQMR